MQTIVCLSLKGGVGKTVLTANLAVGLAKQLPRGKKLLVLDLDPQSNLTHTMLDGQEPAPPTIAAVLQGDVEAIEAVRPSRVARVDILPADYSLADVPTTLAESMGRERRLRTALNDIEADYEVCLIDSSAQLSLLSINALEFASAVLVPADCSVYSTIGIGRLEETILQVRKFLGNDALRILGIVLGRVANNRAAKDLEKALRTAYGAMVFDTTIPESVKVPESIARNRTVLEWAPSSPAGVAFDKLVREVLKHGRKQTHANARHRSTDAA